MNLLEVKYDDDGTRHFFRDGEEVTESVWRQQHPHMRKGNDSGGTGTTDGDDGGDGTVSADQSKAKGQGGKGKSSNKQRAKERAAKAERARRAGDELGRS